MKEAKNILPEEISIKNEFILDKLDGPPNSKPSQFSLFYNKTFQSQPQIGLQILAGFLTFSSILGEWLFKN